MNEENVEIFNSIYLLYVISYNNNALLKVNTYHTSIFNRSLIINGSELVQTQIEDLREDE